MNRRIFLRGLGGAVVAAPFLASLGGRKARAQTLKPPQRLIVMFTHYGCITTRFFPTNSHGPLSKADLEATTLAPLAPHVSKLLIPRGIRAMNEWTGTMVRGQGNDPNLQACGSRFTCQPVTPNSNLPFSFDAATKFNAMAMGPSLDHVIAQQLSPLGVPLLMNLAGQVNESASSAISYSAAETPFKGRTLNDVFSTLTGLFSSGPLSPDTYQAIRGKSVLDLVTDDLATLQRFDMSQADRDKLEAWKELINDTTGLVVGNSCNGDSASRLGATQANVDAEAVPNPSYDLLDQPITDSLDGADIYSSLAALAAVCNASPVIVLKYPADYVFRGLGLTTNSHSLAGRVGNADMSGSCAPNVIDMLLKMDAYYAQKFANLLNMLDALPEGGATVLDNSATVWINEMSDGAANNLNNLPIIQAGGAGGYFKTGWAVNVDDGSATLTSGNSEAVCIDGTPQLIDGVAQTTGTDPSLANAPINKYFCNLMNALGVRAGEDGFPLSGGLYDVSRFGRYDKTEDFIGGGTNPPRITDPGEFTALKANP